MKLSFSKLDNAYWLWVRKNCPARADRSEWENQHAFSFDKTTWRRVSTPILSSTRETIARWSTTFYGSDGRRFRNDLRGRVCDCN